MRHWRHSNPHCTAGAYAEVQGIAREFEKAVGKGPSAPQRTDIASYPDHLIGKGLTLPRGGEAFTVLAEVQIAGPGAVPH